MTPKREPHATLVDLLDRVLDKGLVIQADLIVSVAGIPLIGVNLRAALAGMETMLKYGVMQAWDEKTRAWERENRKEKQENLLKGEEVHLKMLGSLHATEGQHRNWRHGRLYLTSHRLILYHDIFNRILFEISYDQIRGLALGDAEASPEKKPRRELHLLLEGNRWRRLTALHIGEFKKGLDTAVSDAGHPVQDLSAEERETCPLCGKLDMVQALLSNGCTGCGWISPLKTPEIEALA